MTSTNTASFTRIAIVNRGEAAMRLIHAVRDINAGGGREQISTIALFTDAERDAMFVREADISYPLGPAAARPYLSHLVLETALLQTGADAAWVGWGFVAENPSFAEMCARIGVRFIGPSAEAMRKLGDKIGSKLLAEEVGVPVAPWSRGIVDTLDAACTAAASIGYPVMLKASAGGGGRGIRRINDDAELADAYQRTKDEAARAFGSDAMFLESLITGARHIEVQVIADSYGTAWALGVRDCSLQRRNQKVIEESASPLLDERQVADLKASAERLTQAVGYCGAGTVEFLYHPGEKSFSFLEVNTRLQVEHPITESTTDTDLVRLQLHVAAGGELNGPRPIETGHAIEARLNAEDADRDFAPSPGRIELLALPSGPGIRVDTGVGQGDIIPADFDSMIAKIIAHGRTRDEALARLRRAVYETEVIIQGGATNKSFLLELLEQPEVIDASADTSWIDRARAQGRLASQRHSGVALVAAAIEAYQDDKRVKVTRLLQTAHGGRPQVQHRAARPIELKLRGRAYRVAASQIGPQRFLVTVTANGQMHVVAAEVERLGNSRMRLSVSGRPFRVLTAMHDLGHFVEVDGVAHRISRDEGDVLRAPATATVVAISTTVGSQVAAGTPVIFLESMKMETRINAPFSATVRELYVSVGSQVDTGAPLLRIEPIAGEAPATYDQIDLELPEPRPNSRDVLTSGLADLTAVLLGYDIDPDDHGQKLERYLTLRAEAVAQGVDVLPGEVDLLRVFADFTDLSRNRLAADELGAELRVHSPREYFHSYLQNLDLERSGLPDNFRVRLKRVLAHYDITELDRTPQLEGAVFRIFLALQRSAPELAIVTAILQCWHIEPPPDITDVQARGVLDRVALATQIRFPVVGNLARSVRFHWFDQPVVDRERAVALAGVRSAVEALAANPDAADRAEQIQALSVVPEQVVGLLASRLEAGIPRDEPLLEILIRRHYREYDLRDLRSFGVDGRPFAVADYLLDTRPHRLVSTIGVYSELHAESGLAVALASQVTHRAAGQQCVVDLYLFWPDAPQDPDECLAQLIRAVRSLPFAYDRHRIAIGVCPGGGRHVSYFTFCPDGAEVVEDELVRGLHPMVARRLDLWRLGDFDITRIDAPEGILLYHCIAKNNAADQRLVAMAQVRELTVVRQQGDRVSSLPQVERVIASCVEGIRRGRARLSSSTVMLDMNHVWVHIWPIIDAQLDQLTALERDIAPLTADAGIDEVLAQGRVSTSEGTIIPVAAKFFYQPGSGVQFTVGSPPTERLKPLDDYAQKVLRARRRGTTYPYELHVMVAGPGGTLVEYDLDDVGQLAPMDRPAGLNKAGIVVGVVITPTKLHPEGLTRVILSGDPLKALGAVSEGECTRIIAALDLAAHMDVPLEWYALSAGARIAMDSGTENMDWVARALKRIVEFTQAGGEINVVVAGINVGAQPYWNAEATMLMHTKGILVMTPDSAMVLTGKQSLDFSGGVSAEDNFGIGGYDRVMGPNGQAQYWAPDLKRAHEVLMAHYQYSYIVPGEPGPRRAATADPVDRDISDFPHVLQGSDFRTVGEIFSAEANPDRKKPFDIRTVMRALSDQDHPILERWVDMTGAETAVVQDAYVGGVPVCLLGIESQAVPRRGFPPTDGPDTYTAGTLFPRSSKKAAHAINAASGNRGLVVLANLSGFDGSPESMRNLQLEYGAEIGRAIVNFSGPIVFCVLSRYHGGAFVVFSKALNPGMTVLAIEGSFASVIGGAPAAAVVFARDVNKRTSEDPRVRELQTRVGVESGADRGALAADLDELRSSVRVEKLGEVATEFDRKHNIERAVEVGSVDAVIRVAQVRPCIIEIIAAARR